jgi:hypothetical protein
VNDLTKIRTPGQRTYYLDVPRKTLLIGNAISPLAHYIAGVIPTGLNWYKAQPDSRIQEDF